MSSPSKVKTNIIRDILADFPEINFTKSGSFKWDPQTKQVHYKAPSSEADCWSFFHELGHALLDHKTYSSDFELLKMEVLAWQRARTLAEKYGFDVSQDHVEQCIDSYRDWLHGRSKCRRCEQSGLEKTPGIYNCFNCDFTWKVSPARFCRVYRKELVDSG
jgi:hypothetical protein